MGVNNQRDLHLVSLIRNGDDRALESLFTAYYSSLCHFATFLTRREDLTDEIVSDVFIRIWEIRKSLVVDRNLKGYLFRATKNSAINYMRQEKDFFADLDAEIEDSTYGPAELMILHELEEKVTGWIDTLPQQRRIVFQLSRFEGFTYSEIADILNISVKTVESQMGKALRHLKLLYKTGE